MSTKVSAWLAKSDAADVHTADISVACAIGMVDELRQTCVKLLEPKFD